MYKQVIMASEDDVDAQHLLRQFPVIYQCHVRDCDYELALELISQLLDHFLWVLNERANLYNIDVFWYEDVQKLRLGGTENSNFDSVTVENLILDASCQDLPLIYIYHVTAQPLKVIHFEKTSGMC